MKRFYTAVVAFCSLFTIGCGHDTTSDNASDSIAPIAGNWTDRLTGEWTYGFYDDFAIVDRDFWEYESVAVTPSRADITLKRDGESRKITLLRDGAADSLCRSKRGLFRKTPLVRATSYVEATKRDDRPIEDIPLSMDSVEIVGYIPDAESGSSLVFEINNIVHNDDTFQGVVAKTGPDGRFRAKIPCVGFSNILVKGKGIYGGIKCVPGEKIMLTFDKQSKRFLMMGDYARLCNEETAFSEHLQANDDYPDLNYWDWDCDSHEEYLGRVRCEEARGKQRLANYMAAHPHISRRFRQSQELAVVRSILYYATQRRFAQRGDGSDLLPESFTSYLDSAAMLLPRLSHIACDIPGSYFEVRTGRRQSKTNYYHIIEILRYMDDNGLRSLSDEEREMMDIYRNGMDIVSDNSLPEEEWPEGFKEAADRMNALAASDEVRNFIDEKGEDFVQDMVLIRMGILDPAEKIMSTGFDESLKEMHIANLFMQDIKYHKRSMSELWFAERDKYIRNPVLRYYIDAENERYLALERMDFDNPASIMASPEYAADIDAELLWRSLTEDYKGKVLCVDFWGTWCAPCRAELPSMKALSERFAGKDAVFIFFAYRSPEGTWHNVIRDNNLTAPNIVHFNLPDEQMELLVGKFGVNGYPTHALIDRNGKIVPGYFRVSDLESTIEELLK